jgi:hypothetical protein
MRAGANDTIRVDDGPWHPAIRADWLVLRRTGWPAFARVVAAPVLLLACCVAVACGDFYSGYGWCLAADALLALGGSHAIAHQRLLDALERWRFGWCGALPVPRGATHGTLLLIMTAMLMASLAFVTALLLGASMPAPHRDDLPYALAAINLGLVVGTAGAAARVLRRGAVARARHSDGIREPLLALAWLNDPRLPHLLDWQRRAALVRWRRGAGAAMAALALFAIPDGAPVLGGSGLVVLVISVAWLDVVLRACAKATAEAARLLQPTPAGGDRLRPASLRYPLLAMGCTLVLAVAGAILASGGSGAAGLGGAACAVAVSVWPLGRMVAARHPKPAP